MTDKPSKYNRETDYQNLICPYCESKNEPTDFVADGFFEGETDCVKCEKVFNFLIEYHAIYITETMSDD